LLDDARLGRYIIKQIDLHFGFICASSCLSSPDISSSLIYSTRALLLVVSGMVASMFGALVDGMGACDGSAARGWVSLVVHFNASAARKALMALV
jgi:hypothetical protein